MKSLFRCPVCGGPLDREERVYRCADRHSYDIAREGYTYLLPPNQKHSAAPGDDKAMAAARRAFLSKGYYRPLLNTLCSRIAVLPGEKPVILDAGCGEGYYTGGIRQALAVAGKHNVSNALAAAAAAYVLGISGKAVEEGLHSFHGAGRRFEYKGSFRGAEVYDDYAHHPGELHALLTTARSMACKRVICAFQPHTYTRTQALFSDFVKELKLADVAVLAEIYAARETNDIGISSSQLAEKIPGAIYCSTLDQVADTLAQIAQPGDLILTVGAGDIFRAGEKLLAMENKT